MSSPRIASLAALLATAACSFEGKKSKNDSDSEPAVVSAADADTTVVAKSARDRPGSASRSSAPNFKEGPGGEVWMMTRTGAMLMRLRHDSVLVGFSDSLRRSVKAEVDTSFRKDSSSGDNSAIGHIVKSAVQATVQTTLNEVFDKERGFPVSDLKDARYEDGAIVFDYRHKPAITPDKVHNDGESLLREFHPADAARFVGAVRSRLARH